MRVYGASGAIGSSALQLAKLSGAEVAAVVATRHVPLARSLGADRVIDYTKEDFTGLRERFDFVLDAVGKTSFFKCRKVLKPDEVYAATDLGAGGQNLALLLWSAVTANGRIAMPAPARGTATAFVSMMRGLLERGAFRAIIDRHYPLEAITEAYRYVDAGQKTGIVVLDFAPPADRG